ncbi:EAL domain-containing protein, partial [Listeria monocytogenes]|uniref:EAL domain-containing protein n=1 Tax=Listeria monocytogenes TaxID=1639 RepID=UPI00215A4AC3
ILHYSWRSTNKATTMIKNECGNWFGCFLVTINSYRNIAIDDVSCGLNSLERVMSYLPYIIEIKFSLIHFKNIPLEDLLLFIKAWANFAQKNKLDFVVEGIETKETMTLLESHGVSIFQGYLVNKPFPV